MTRGTSLLLAALVPGLLGLGTWPPARAAPPMHLEEHEARLKALGVDAALAARITAAIDRGTAWLAKTQRPDGSWQDPIHWELNEWGTVALCALAQRHAGTPEAVASVRKALPWLEARRAVRARRSANATPLRIEVSPRNQVYTVGIWAMLLAADGRPAADLRESGDALARSLDARSSWWAYETAPPGSAGTRTLGAPNLSTSQFGALGLRSAARAGVVVDGRVWRAHLDSLVRWQRPSGSWAYGPFPPPSRPVPFRQFSEYPTGTFMGAANLALAMDGADVTPTRPLDREVAPARQRAIEALRRDGGLFLRELDPARPGFAFVKERGFSYYALYALEKACVFLDLDRLGDVPWYAVGAKHLLDIQDARGSWSCRGDLDPLLSTAFALLFLLRSSEVYRPTTPRDVVPARPRTTTEPDSAPPTPGPPR